MRSPLSLFLVSQIVPSLSAFPHNWAALSPSLLWWTPLNSLQYAQVSLSSTGGPRTGHGTPMLPWCYHVNRVLPMLWRIFLNNHLRNCFRMWKLQPSDTKTICTRGSNCVFCVCLFACFVVVKQTNTNCGTQNYCTQNIRVWEEIVDKGLLHNSMPL